jgi:hypothetical protein
MIGGMLMDIPGAGKSRYGKLRIERLLNGYCNAHRCVGVKSSACC